MQEEETGHPKVTAHPITIANSTSEASIKLESTRIVQWNADELKNKIVELRKFVKENGVSVCVI